MAIVLQLQGISKSFGPRLLFDDATLSVAEGQRIGLIGANGAGKTTLFKMILGQDEITGGQVVFHPTARLGYLEQQEVFPEGETVMQYLVRISGCESWECGKMASTFEITHERLEAPFLSLSGGYQMRVRLAGILLKDPNLLLLDEPTNYLDLQTVLLLESALQKYRGGLLLISHDREFLKNVCTHTLELEHGKLNLYPGDVESYLAFKEARLAEQQRYNKKIQAQRAHLQTFVDRFRYKAALAAQAQNKLKQIERLKSIEIAHSLRTVRMVIPNPPLKKGVALTCKDLAVGYREGQPILRNVDFEIQRGDHVAILGENGQGKTTLLKSVAGELASLEGSYKWGHGIRVAYYAQHIAQMLPKSGTAAGYLCTVSGLNLEEELLRMAGNFLFTKEDLEKPITLLSGGERARLCLAGIFLGRYDALILDEPTNHLDFDTVEALGEALQEFTGTVLFVSHDRTFVSQIATTILDVRDGKVRRYPYPYEIYVYELQTHETFTMPDEDEKNDGDVPYVRTRTDVYQDIQKQKGALSKLEEKMKKLTEEQFGIHQYFNEHPGKPDVQKAKRLKEIADESMQAEADWFKGHDQLEVLVKEMKTAKE